MTRIHARVFWTTKENPAVFIHCFNFHSVIGKRSLKLEEEGTVPFKYQPMFFLTVDAAGRAVQAEVNKWRKSKYKRLVKVEMISVEVDRHGQIIKIP